MPENYSKITGNQGGSRPAPASPSLPPPGSVVMATVEENLGDGVYSLRWGGNRVTVSSRAALNQGETLILKSEMSPEGKPILVVQGPALPNIKEPIVRNLYSPAHRKASDEARPEEVAAGSQPASRPAGRPLDPGATLQVILEELPDPEESRAQLQASAEDEIRKNEPERSPQAKTREQAQAADGEKKPAPGQPADKSARPAETPPATDNKPAPAPEGGASSGKAPPIEGTPGKNAAVSAVAEVKPGQEQAPPVAAERPAAPVPGADASQSSPPKDAPPVQNAGTPPATQRPAVESPPPALAQTASEPAAVQPQPERSATLPGDLARPAADTPPPAAAKPVPAPPSSQLMADALEQIAKAASLPLGGGLDRLMVGKNGAVPDAIADKAATILLTAAGLTPGPATLEAARALMNYNVTIDRQTIQTLLALTAGAEEGDRAALLQAGARLAASDIPMAAPLASGLADILVRKAGISHMLTQTLDFLDPAAVPDVVKPQLDTANRLLQILTVDLERPDAAHALERFVSTLGREALGKATALVENAVQTLLENNPQLTKIDQALSAILTLLENDAGGGTPTGTASAAGSPPASGQQTLAQPGTGAPVANPASPLPGQESAGGQPTARPVPDAALATPPADMAATANGTSGAAQTQPAPLPGTNPPGGGQAPTPGQAGTPGQPTVAGQPQPVPLPGGNPPAGGQAPTPGQTGEPTQPPASGQAQTGSTAPAGADVARYDMLDGADTAQQGAATSGRNTEIARKAAQTIMDQAASSVMDKLKSLFQLPGVNSREMELLRPSGYLDRLLNDAGLDGGAKTSREAVQETVKDLLSDSPEKSQAALRELPAKGRQLLREAAARLTEMERSLLRNDPAINRLADAAGSLRDLGRQLIAVKAENLAGIDREPGVMLAEVPFKLADQGGDGRMQMFYRRSKSQKGSWTARVILDLNTTNMGPVLGDMRFFGQDMVLNLFVGNADTAAYLARSAEDLSEALLAKGFRLKPKFLVLPPPPPPPEIKAEPPALPPSGPDAGADGEGKTPIPPSTRRGKLDTRA